MTASQVKDQADLAECTFKPKINQLNPNKSNLYGLGIKQKTYSYSNRDPQIQLYQTQDVHLEEVIENKVHKQMPRGYAKQVERMRKTFEAKEKFKQEEHKKNVGERYDKNRLQ